jgi:hypothetical protein
MALKTTQELVGMLPAAAGDLDRLRVLLSALRLCCRIFYSLNAPGLTPVSSRACGVGLWTWGRVCQGLAGRQGASSSSCTGWHNGWMVHHTRRWGWVSSLPRARHRFGIAVSILAVSGLPHLAHKLLQTSVVHPEALRPCPRRGRTSQHCCQIVRGLAAKPAAGIV